MIRTSVYGLQNLGAARRIDVSRLLSHLAITQILDDLKDLRPTGEGPVIDLLVFVNRHDEIEKLAGDFAFFGGPANLATSPPGAATAIHANAPFR